MKHIFIDTNIFLHFENFEKIDWLNEFKTKTCKLIIPPIVIDELDKKKIGTSKISNKARTILNRFEELSKTENSLIKENVFFEILLYKPSKLIYEVNDLNFDEQDHRLIASIIDFRDKSGNLDIELCTNDIGPRLRAKQYGINALTLNEKYLLPKQISEEEKKIKLLENENRLLKTKIPSVQLKFGNLKEFTKINVKPNNNLDFKSFRDKRLTGIKLENPILSIIENNSNKKPEQILLRAITSLSEQQINDYNNKLENYYSKYENVLDEIYEYEIQKNLTFNLNFIVSSCGNIPAEDVDIHLHFPDGFELIETDEMTEPPELPEPPYKPKNRLDFGISQYPTGIYGINPIVGSNYRLNSPTIKKTNSYNVDYHRKSLKHGYNEKLEELSIIFSTYENIQNFNIDYELSAANIPQKIIGKLNVIFNK